MAKKDKELKTSPGQLIVPDFIPGKEPEKVIELEGDFIIDQNDFSDKAEPEKELPKPDKIKVEVVGSVFNGKEYLTGVVEMDYNSAVKLIDSGHVKPVEE